MSSRPAWLPLVDLRAITRHADSVETTIEVLTRDGYFLWLRFGSLSRLAHGDNTCWLGAWMSAVTDDEHDAAYAFGFNTTPVALDHIFTGVIHLTGWIAGADDDLESFQVPSVRYHQ